MINFSTLKLIKEKLPCAEQNKGQRRNYQFAEVLEKDGKKELNKKFKQDVQEAKFESRYVWGKWTWVYLGEIVMA